MLRSTKRQLCKGLDARITCTTIHKKATQHTIEAMENTAGIHQLDWEGKWLKQHRGTLAQ
jgi:hypothetical protein